MTFREQVAGLVSAIPRGRVVTYGQIAALLRRPRAARAVGGALRGTGGSRIPWHRVVNARGGLSPRAQMSSVVTQRILLEQEGVVLRGGRVALARYRWKPKGGVRCGSP